MVRREYITARIFIGNVIAGIAYANRVGVEFEFNLTIFKMTSERSGEFISRKKLWCLIAEAVTFCEYPLITI
jgi:hypothetical protein